MKVVNLESIVDIHLNIVIKDVLLLLMLFIRMYGALTMFLLWEVIDIFSYLWMISHDTLGFT